MAKCQSVGPFWGETAISNTPDNDVCVRVFVWGVIYSSSSASLVAFHWNCVDWSGRKRQWMAATCGGGGGVDDVNSACAFESIRTTNCTGQRRRRRRRLAPATNGNRKFCVRTVGSISSLAHWRERTRARPQTAHILCVACALCLCPVVWTLLHALHMHFQSRRLIVSFSLLYYRE